MKCLIPSILSIVSIASTLLPDRAYADLDRQFGGRLQSNIRFRPARKGLGDFFDRRELAPGIARNEYILKTKLNAQAGNFGGVIDVDFVWANFARANSFDDLTLRENVEPTRFEAHSAYVEGLDLIFEGLDLRVGQQIVSWGVGDQFNPTNNINANDVEDRLLYGVQQANLMAKLDYTLDDYLSLSAVLIPVFKPALLPASGALALAAVERLPHLDPSFRRRLHAEAAAAREFGFGTTVNSINVLTPETNFKNMQYAFRVATNIAEQDIAFSYYRGFSDFPQPVVNFARQVSNMQCDPSDMMNCVDGTIQTDVTLAYPRMHVAGLNITGEFDALGWISDIFNPIGYRIELGVFFPDQVRMQMLQDEIVIGPVTRPAGSYEPLPGGQDPLIIDNTPFAKWTVGVDYTFNKYLYMNLQWVHGLFDEFGAGDFISEGYSVRGGGLSTRTRNEALDPLNCALPELGELNPDVCVRELLRPRLGDFLVVGLDFKFNNGDGLIRFFSILDLTGFVEEDFDDRLGRRTQRKISPFSAEGISLVLYPEINYNFGSGFELGGGALVYIGKNYTKFGDPAAGGSVIFTRARFSF